MKEYSVSDLFYTDWKHLKPKVHEEVYALREVIKQYQPDQIEYGITLIRTLRLLRKRPLLVDKINEAQAVDIYNDLQFLNKPWFYFAELASDLRTPDEKMARCSFDQFIYADNEFSQYILTRDEKYLARLAATLYLKQSDEYFDPEVVAPRAESFAANNLPLLLVFFTFGHVRNFVVDRCKHLLPKGDGEMSGPSGPMWYEIKHQAAKTLVFGTFETLGRANMYSVLDHLNLLARDNHQQHANA